MALSRLHNKVHRVWNQLRRSRSSATASESDTRSGAPTVFIASSTSTTKGDSTHTEDNSSIDTMSIVSTLFPPKLAFRQRSLSNVSVASAPSRPGTPAPSIAPSTPHCANLSPRSSTETEQPPILNVVPRIVQHLDAPDILNLSATTRQCRNLRTSLTFQQHLSSNGWDTDAVVRRAEQLKGSKGRPWMFLARSALEKGDILEQYALLPKHDCKKTSSKEKRAVEKFLRILVDVATEHDQRNFIKLSSLAASLGLNIVQFVTAVQAHDWKTRYRKTFVIAAFTNSQPQYPEAERDLEALSETLDFDNTKPPLSFVAARANFLYTFGCVSSTINCAPKSLSSVAYDPPHLCTPRGTSLPGMHQAIERFTRRTAVKGFYRKKGGEISALNMDIEPKGLASKSSIPFADKNLLTITVIVSDDEGHEPWQMEGFVDHKTGVGKLKTVSGIMYEIWTTPWGLAGEKFRAEGAHMGYFVLQWA